MTQSTDSNAILIDAHSHMDGYKAEDLSLALTEISENRIFTVSTATDILSLLTYFSMASWLLL